MQGAGAPRQSGSERAEFAITQAQGEWGRLPNVPLFRQRFAEAFIIRGPKPLTPLLNLLAATDFPI